MRRSKQDRRRDPLERDMELTLALGGFIDYGAAWSFASGHRLALIYNLIRKYKSPLPKPLDYEREQQQAASLLCEWSRNDTSASSPVSDSDSGPTKLIYPLEHAYTQAELEFATLKGADAAVADQRCWIERHRLAGGTSARRADPVQLA